MDFETLRVIAEEEVAAVVRALPEPLRIRARKLPVTFESRPNRLFRRDGIEADTLGLFVGPAFADEERTSSPVPPQIILFLENLWECAEFHEGCYRQEVRDTFLHELGHYLGLDEDDLLGRGL